MLCHILNINKDKIFFKIKINFESLIFFLYPRGLFCALLFGDHWSRAVVLNHRWLSPGDI